MPAAAPSFMQQTTASIEKFIPIAFVHKITFVEHLRIMLKAGLSIVEALHILIKQTTVHKLARLITAITAKVEKGQTLSEALDQYPHFIPGVYVRMIAAGEASGTLESALQHVETQMKRTRDLKARIRGAMIYPVIVFAALGAIGVEMMWYVLPKLLDVFREFDAELPLATRILIAVSEFMVAWGVWIAVGVVALIILFIILYRREIFKKIVHTMLLKIPIIGKIVRKINLARFATTLTSLLGSGISIVEALQITVNVIPNRPYRLVLEKSAVGIKKGADLSELLGSAPALFPPMVTGMIGTGERTGSIETLLNEVANYYNDDVDRTLKNLNSVIEPLIILFLGVVVAAMAIAVVMPMLTLTQSI